MSVFRVKSDFLNLRSTPDKTSGANIIRPLPLAQEVNVLSGAPTDRWWNVETEIDGKKLTGFVSAAFLRQPVSTGKESLIGAAMTEWLRFKQGNGLEDDDPYYRFVGQYWQKLGISLDGRDTDQPWSAAFISFVVHQAKYSSFKFAAAHHFYIRDAIEKQKDGVSAPFWGFKLGNHKPQLGDLVAQWRETSVAFDRLPSGGFKSHCDIIVELGDNEVRAVGGNVGNSVSIRSFQLDSSGFLKPGKVFAILRNNN